MNNNKLDDDEINFTPLIHYINYMNILHNDYLKKKYKNLTPTDVTYLLNIFYHHGFSQKDLAQLLLVSEANVTQIIQRLEKNEYIVRTPDEKNKSRKILSLTHKGKTTVFKILKEMYEWEGQFFKDYDPEDVEKFKKMIYDYIQKTLNVLD